MNTPNTLLSPLLTVTYAAILCLALLLPVPQSAHQPTVGSGLLTVLFDYDLATHFSAFAIWGLLVSSWPNSRHRSSVIPTAFAIGYAISLEIIQGLLPYRTFEWPDLAANFAGTALGYYLGIFWIFRRN